MEYRDAIKSKETRQGSRSACNAVVKWMMVTSSNLYTFFIHILEHCYLSMNATSIFP